MVQVMYIISVLSLRSPENAARAIEAGAGDLVIQAMEKFPAAQQMQRNSCLMIRNLVVRNPENRLVLQLPSVPCYWHIVASTVALPNPSLFLMLLCILSEL